MSSARTVAIRGRKDKSIIRDMDMTNYNIESEVAVMAERERERKQMSNESRAFP